MRVFEFEQFLNIIAEGGTINDFIEKNPEYTKKEVKTFIKTVIELLERRK